MRNLLTAFLVFIVLPATAISQEWEDFSDEGKVTVQKRVEQCTNERGTVFEYVFLKFTNETNEDLTLNFQLPMWLDGKYNANLADGETGKTLFIPANSSVEGDCDAKLGTLKIYSKMISMEGGSRLTNFEIQNLSAE